MAKRTSKSTDPLSQSQDGTEDCATLNEQMAASIVGLDSLSENRTPSKKSKRLHLFGTILTYASPSSNHHGKGDETESPLQTITKQGRDYPIISPYAIRSALREILIVEELPSNRWRSLPEVIANQ